MFLQDPPQLGNTFDADRALQARLAHVLPRDLTEQLRPEWRALGEEAAGPLKELARQAEAQPPRHVPFDAWGRRVDQIEVAPAWTALHAAAARWGLTAIPYERKLGPWARVHQFALLNLYGPSSAIYSCPLAMTDGAARTLLEHGPRELVERAVPHLTSRDPQQLWTSGQWMTERAGGSDVSGTETEAVQGEDGAWRLFGLKWFTSATTSEIALTLARPRGAPDGSRGLQLFYLEQRRADGTLNGIVIHRLKDKLGTKALPTAELSLNGTVAVPIGAVGEGVKRITPLLNTTRLHNAINACGLMARALQLQRDYARKRRAFGARLSDKPLHRQTLAAAQVEYEAALALTFDAVRLLGRLEAGEATATEQAALRLLTPLAKLMTAKQAVAVCSEALEGFGGAGYVEDTGLPVLLRNAQVLPIWEGTTNVLALDVLRAIAREQALDAWIELARTRMPAHDELRRRIEALSAWLRSASSDPEFLESAAREVALECARLAAALPLLEDDAPSARAWLARSSTLPDITRAAERRRDGALLGMLED